MRVFTKVSPQVWSSPAFRALPDDARLLFHYYLSSPHQTSAGCCGLPDGYAITDLGWEMDRYRSARTALADASMVKVDLDSSEILVMKWFKHNPAMNPSHRKSIVRAIQQIASKALQGCAQQELEAAELEARQLQQAPALSTPLASAALLRSRGYGKPGF
jgi:hypothetical protein